jgi:penicillin-binding protein 2
VIDPVPSDRRPPVSPQLALRVAALGVVAFVLFAVIFFRLWYLQVLSGDQYLAQAQTNKVRVQPLPAPRGSIVDRDGETIVANRSAIVVKIKPETLPASEKKAAALYGEAVIARSKRAKGRQGPPVAIPATPPDLMPRFRRLARTLAMKTSDIQSFVIRGLFLAGYAPITIKTDVDEDVRGYIAERQEQFPGVSVDTTFLRTYPNHELAAQLLGTASQISPDQLKAKAYKGVPAGSVVGQSGIEREYDQFLRGRDGKERLLVDAQGNPRGEGLRREPNPGRDVQLTLSLKLQRAGQAAYSDVAGTLPGAFVAMDPRNGDVLAMGSFPTFDPNVLVGNISQKRYDAIFNTGTTPQFNRVTGAHYATGSTFKPITALAALESGKITTTDTIDDTGCIKIGIQERCNAKKAVFGPVDLRNALRVSSDVFFYTLGERTNVLRNPKGGPIQRVAREFGFERPTGIDLPGESGGLVPDPAWRKQVAQDEIDCRKKKKIPVSAPGDVAAAGGCGISDMRPWSIGDNVSLSIGQGDLQATPLQMAVAYAGFAEDGRIPRPRLGAAVLDEKGLPQQKLPPSGARRVKLDPSYRDVIMAGLHDAASAPGGTSTSVFGGWNQSRFPVYGKTGTAQVTTRVEDQSWYVAYSYDGPDHKRPIVVAVTVEDGGFGAARAAPIACRVMKAWCGRGSNRQAGCAPGADASL